MEEKQSKSSIKIEDIIEKAKSVGFIEVPQSTTALEADIARIFQQTGKKFTAQAIHGLLKNKYSNPAKYYSDKLYYMRLKGTLVHTGTRGWYEYNKGEGNPSS